MVSGYSRRELFSAGVGGAGALLAGGYAWNQHATRYHLQFRPLEAVNESPDTVVLEVTVEHGEFEASRTVRLDPADADGGADRQHLPGRWMKTAEKWTIRAEHGDRTLELEANELADRLDRSGWGPGCARVTIVVAGNDLDSWVEPSESC